LELDILQSKDGKELLVFNTQLKDSHLRRSLPNGIRLLTSALEQQILKVIKK
jgi:hypothetical protein